jgi:hypothetical protein
MIIMTILCTRMSHSESCSHSFQDSVSVLIGFCLDNPPSMLYMLCSAMLLFRLVVMLEDRDSLAGHIIAFRT